MCSRHTRALCTEGIPSHVQPEGHRDPASEAPREPRCFPGRGRSASWDGQPLHHAYKEKARITSHMTDGGSVLKDDRGKGGKWRQINGSVPGMSMSQIPSSSQVPLDWAQALGDKRMGQFNHQRSAEMMGTSMHQSGRRIFVFPELMFHLFLFVWEWRVVFQVRNSQRILYLVTFVTDQFNSIA